jgi:hypothetical protein
MSSGWVDLEIHIDVDLDAARGSAFPTVGEKYIAAENPTEALDVAGMTDTVVHTVADIITEANGEHSGHHWEVVDVHTLETATGFNDVHETDGWIDVSFEPPQEFERPKHSSAILLLEAINSLPGITAQIEPRRSPPIEMGFSRRGEPGYDLSARARLGEMFAEDDDR